MKVFIIGTGNVATVMGKAIQLAGHKITGVWGRDHQKAKKLATKLKTSSIEDISGINKDNDIVLIAVKDDAIVKVANSLPPLKAIVAHTSGSIPLILSKKLLNTGVIYPVETITKLRKPSFKNIPFCIESSNEKSLKRLLAFASTLSDKLYVLDSGQREALHLSAVLTNNFTNYILGIAGSVLKENNIPFELIEPLALSTLKSAFKNDPFLIQTGPARRNDQITINKHLKYLNNNKEYKELYRLITEQIITKYK